MTKVIIKVASLFSSNSEKSSKLENVSETESQLIQKTVAIAKQRIEQFDAENLEQVEDKVSDATIVLRDGTVKTLIFYQKSTRKLILN